MKGKSLVATIVVLALDMIILILAIICLFIVRNSNNHLSVILFAAMIISVISRICRQIKIIRNKYSKKDH